MMYDVDLGLNDSAAIKVAQSKISTFCTLDQQGIPAVEHFLLLNAYSPFELPMTEVTGF